MKHIRFHLLAYTLISALLVFSCEKTNTQKTNHSVAVFVPGMVSGSPIYSMLVQGAEKAARKAEAAFKVIEAGYDQSTWFETLRSAAASGQFDIIVSSNPSMPELCAKLTGDYPDIRFIIADAWYARNSSIHTVLYNQKEQGYIVGYLSGLYMREQGTHTAAAMVIAQHYPTLDTLIIPGYEAGLKAVDNSFTLTIREIGNWYDSAKAGELAGSLYDSGVEVILPIAGSAGQGIIAAARERNKKVVWFDGGYEHAPDTVIGCAVIAQDRLIERELTKALDGTLRYGTADIVGAQEGFVGFDAEGPGYQLLPESIKQALHEVLVRLKNGEPAALRVRGL